MRQSQDRAFPLYFIHSLNILINYFIIMRHLEMVHTMTVYRFYKYGMYKVDTFNNFSSDSNV